MAIEHSLEEGSISVKEFFDNYKIEISEFQRPYVWGGKEVLKLWNDLLYYFDEDIEKSDAPYFYLGTFIMAKKNEIYSVIDGQQRITTLLIIGNLLQTKWVKDQNIGVNSSISEENIKKNASYLKFLLSEAKTKNNSTIDFNRINITYVCTGSDDLAFKFYTTLNTSGKRLDGIDIVKPFHLQAVDKTTQNDYARAIEKYQFENNRLEFTAKLLLKCRYWEGFNFRKFPRKDSDNWKKELPDIFAYPEMVKNGDTKYIEGSYINGNPNLNLPAYKIRQPISKGENFINYLIYYCEIFSDIEKTLSEIFLEKLNTLNGIEFCREYFEMALLTYVSKFGKRCIKDENFKNIAGLLFKICFYCRLNKPVKETTVFEFEKATKLLDRISYAFTKGEIISFCENYYNAEKIKNIPETGVVKNFTEKFNFSKENKKQPFLIFNKS